MRKFSAMLNLPSMHSKSYTRLSKKVSLANIVVAESILSAESYANIMMIMIRILLVIKLMIVI